MAEKDETPSGLFEAPLEDWYKSLSEATWVLWRQWHWKESVNKTSSILPKALGDVQLDLVKVLPVIPTTRSLLLYNPPMPGCFSWPLQLIQSGWYVDPTDESDSLSFGEEPWEENFHNFQAQCDEHRIWTYGLRHMGGVGRLDQLPSKLTVDDNFKVDFRTSSICNNNMYVLRLEFVL